MDSNYENIQPSFRVDNIHDQQWNIDYLCETYLGNQDDLSLKSPENFFIMTDPIVNKQTDFLHKDARKWNREDCYHWASSVKNRLGDDAIQVDAMQFLSLDGQRLLQCTCQDFCSLLGNFTGSVFYEELQRLRSKKDKS
ncbi:hypothetical protein SK128_002185, partial [Halocaridina rubra]